MCGSRDVRYSEVFARLETDVNQIIKRVLLLDPLSHLASFLALLLEGRRLGLHAVRTSPPGPASANASPDTTAATLSMASVEVNAPALLPRGRGEVRA